MNEIGNNNGAITTTINGGNFPFTFEWATPDNSMPTTENLANIAPGSYTLTITDNDSLVTTCNTVVGMDSQPTNCGGETIHWDGGLILENGFPTRDDDNNLIVQGDGQSWSDPFNWSEDRLPNANDVVGGIPGALSFSVGAAFFETRSHVNLDINDVTVEALSFGNVGLTVSANQTLTAKCSFLASKTLNNTIIHHK